MRVIEQLLGDDAWLYADIVGFAHVIAQAACHLLLQPLDTLRNVEALLVVALDDVAAAVVHLHDKLVGQARPVDILSTVPLAVELHERFGEATILNKLAHSVLVGKTHPS